MSGRPESPPPLLRVVPDPGTMGDRLQLHDSVPVQEDVAAEFMEALRSAEERARAMSARIAHVQTELNLVRTELGRTRLDLFALPHADVVLRVVVAALAVGVLGLALWARAVDYALRVTSDTPTFIALVTDMAADPFAAQSPFLDGGTGTQHATPYMQTLAFLWGVFGGEADTPVAIGRFLALVGIVVFAATLWCVFLYVRRLAGATAAWVSVPVLLGIFGPPHVIWASDLSLHAALYAGFFPQNVALATTLLTLLALERRTRASLAAACLLAMLTMLVHPFTGVLLSVLATVWSCQLAVRKDRNAARAPIAIGLAFAVGMLWPAYSLDRAFAEKGMRGLVFIGVCIAAPLIALTLRAARGPFELPGSVGRVLTRLESADTAFRLALVGAAGTALIVAWEWALVRSPPEESARLAIYWVDDRWRWPLLLVAGVVGISGLARLARRGRIVIPVWFVGCFALGALGAIGLPLPVWYRFLLLCQVPLTIGVAIVVADRPQRRTTAVVAATFALALTFKVVTLLHAPPTVSYFGQPLQPAWSLGEHVPPGLGLVATDPATAYFVPAATGHRVLTVHKGHVSSRRELDQARGGYRLLRRYYAGGSDWWRAGQEMWRRGVRYVVVQKQTTLEPRTLDAFIWQSALLRTPAQRRALGNYFYENNRVGDLIYDSEDFVVYRLDHEKLFGNAEGGGNG
jgi:hypothetical protein